MFTIKLFNFYEDGSSNYTAIHSPHYQVYERPNKSITITIYSNNLKTDGVDYHIAHPSLIPQFAEETKHQYYECAYIENEQGKTIDVIRPKGVSTGSEVE